MLLRFPPNLGLGTGCKSVKFGGVVICAISKSVKFKVPMVTMMPVVNIFLRNILPKRMSFPNFQSNSLVRFLRNFTVGNGIIFFKLVLSTDGRVCTSLFVTKNRGGNARRARPTAFYPMKFLPKSVINSRVIPSLSLPLRPARRFGTNGSKRPIKRPESTPKKPVSNKNRFAFRLGWPNKIFGMPRSTLSPKPNEVGFKD